MPTHLLLKGSTLWGLNAHYDPPEDPLSPLKKIGASTIEVSDVLLTPELIDKITAARLSLVIQAYPLAGDDLEPVMALAKTTKARAVNLQVRLPHASHESAVNVVNDLIERGSGAGIPVLFETHRGCITQDLLRTAQLVEAVPAMRLTMDVSHYVLAGQKAGPTTDLAPLMDGLLDRVDMIHGRISNGQQIPVPTVDVESELALRYQSFWAEAMRRWRRRNPAGTSLIFNPEIEPQPNTVTASHGPDVPDRMAETELIWKIAQAAWKQSARAGKEPCWG